MYDGVINSINYQEGIVPRWDTVTTEDNFEIVSVLHSMKVHFIPVKILDWQFCSQYIKRLNMNKSQICVQGKTKHQKTTLVVTLKNLYN